MIYLMLKDARLQSLYLYRYRLSLHILAFYPNAQRPRNRHTVTGHRKATLCVLLLVIGTIDNARVCQRATIFPLRILPHENLRLDTDLRCSQPHTLLSLHHADHLLNQSLQLWPEFSYLPRLLFQYRVSESPYPEKMSTVSYTHLTLPTNREV